MIDGFKFQVNQVKLNMEVLGKSLRDNTALNNRIEELSKQVNAENAGINYSATVMRVMAPNKILHNEATRGLQSNSRSSSCGAHLAS